MRAVFGAWLVLMSLWAAMIYFAVTGPVVGNDNSQTEALPGQVCFPAEKWNADDSERPCARIVRLWEDGSARVRVSSADGAYQFTSNTGARR